MLKSRKIVVTGGSGRFGKLVFSVGKNFLFPKKKLKHIKFKFY